MIPNRISLTLLVVMLTAMIPGILVANTETNGPDGVNGASLSILGLDGSGVTVGQVEPLRPGLEMRNGMPLAASSVA